LLTEKKDNKTKAITTVIVLILIIAILLLVWYYKQLQLKKEKEKQQLAYNLAKAETKMENERAAQQIKQEHLIKEQREKISKNIHDEINSGLAALRFYITDLKSSATESKTKEVLAKVEEEAEHLYLQARDFMNNLNADKTIANYNVLSLLENLAARFNDESILHIENKIDEAGIEKNFTAKQHYEMYSVIKEAITNIIKHAGASKAIISIAFNDNRCEFFVADNGKGFNRQQIKEGLGLKSLESRIVDELHGELKINSTAKGTVVSGSFPV
jgi:signal transduction histidine kinase